jgi:RHS repeat-associated protein
MGKEIPSTPTCMQNGQLLTTYVYSQSKWIYAFNDWLGTKHVTTDPARATTETCVGLPFGDALNCSGGIDPSEHHFTGKERDNESGLDYMDARYYGSTMGRFMSPDPLGGHTEDPQTLNRYAYARNNPLVYTDTTGLDFNLDCAKNNGTTCQGGNAYYKDANGDYQKTVIKSDDKGNLSDQSGNKYSGTFDGKNVSFAGADGSKSNGSWIQGSSETKGITGGGELSDKFQFTFSDHGNGQALHASFTYGGTFNQAQSELEKAGYSFSALDGLFNLREGFAHPNAENFRTPGDPGTGRNSGHFLVEHPLSSLLPRYSVPTTGSVHTGETNPWGSVGAAIQHLEHEQ